MVRPQGLGVTICPRSMATKGSCNVWCRIQNHCTQPRRGSRTSQSQITRSDEAQSNRVKRMDCEQLALTFTCMFGIDARKNPKRIPTQRPGSSFLEILG